VRPCRFEYEIGDLSIQRIFPLNDDARIHTSVENIPEQASWERKCTFDLAAIGWRRGVSVNAFPPLQLWSKPNINNLMVEKLSRYLVKIAALELV
jgi:hypothetical protein